jgi:hypothetical protein
VGERAIVRNSVVGPGATIEGGVIVRGLSMLGAGCIVEEGNVRDQGARINPMLCLPKGTIAF